MRNDIKQKKLHRIKIIKGHVAAVEKMIEHDEYCIKVLHQSLAIQKALKKLDMEIMEHHLKHCVIDGANKGNNEKIINELVDIYNYKS